MYFTSNQKAVCIWAFSAIFVWKKSKLWHNLVPRYPENSDIRDNLYFSIVLTNAKSYIQNFSSLTTKLHGVYWPSVNFNLYVKWLLKFFILCRFVHRVSTWFLESQYFRTGGKHFSYLTQLSLSLFFIYRRNSILVRLSESRAEHRAHKLFSGDSTWGLPQQGPWSSKFPVWRAHRQTFKIATDCKELIFI